MYIHSFDNVFSHRSLQGHRSSGRFRLVNGWINRDGQLHRAGNCDGFVLSGHLQSVVESSSIFELLCIRAPAMRNFLRNVFILNSTIRHIYLTLYKLSRIAAAFLWVFKSCLRNFAKQT